MSQDLKDTSSPCNRTTAWMIVDSGWSGIIGWVKKDINAGLLKSLSQVHVIFGAFLPRAAIADNKVSAYLTLHTLSIVSTAFASLPLWLARRNKTYMAKATFICLYIDRASFFKSSKLTWCRGNWPENCSSLSLVTIEYVLLSSIQSLKTIMKWS